MAEFKEILLERIRAQYAVRDAPGQNGYGVEFKNAALFGAKAALEMAAEDGEEQARMLQEITGHKSEDGPRVDCRWLRARARGLEADRG